MESIPSQRRLFRNRRLRGAIVGVLIVSAVVVDLLFSSKAALALFILVAAVELIVVVGFVRGRVSSRRSDNT